MGKTFKDEVLKAIAKTKTDRIGLEPIARRLQDEYMRIESESIDTVSDENLEIQVGYSKVNGVLQHCELILLVDDLNDNGIAVILTEKQILKFAQKLLSKYEQLNSINDKLRGLGIESSIDK